MGRFTFDTSIVKDIKKATADSYSSNIKMVDIDEIEPNKNNFYSLSDIEILADDIERQGLKNSLVVVENAKTGIESDKKYTIISGHRRYEATRLLLNENRITSRLVPVYVELAQQDDIMLDLIMLNATARIMSDSEVFEQYKRLDEIFRSMEKNGRPFKGRIRDQIAKAMNISPAQAGKIENINHNAIPEIHEAVKSGAMSISTANEAAKLKPENQKNLIEQKKPEEIKHKEIKSMVAEEKKSKAVPEQVTEILENSDKDKEEAETFLPDTVPDDEETPDEKWSANGEEFEEMEEFNSGDFEENNKPEEYTDTAPEEKIILDGAETKLLLRYFSLILDGIENKNGDDYSRLINIKKKLEA